MNKLKRIHLFEFEDLNWFPHWLRRCMTRLIIVMHNLLGTGEKVAGLIAKMLKESNATAIIYLCSGSRGPMPEVLKILNEKYGIDDIHLTLTDLYPDLEAAELLNKQDRNNISYMTTPVDATHIDGRISGLKTMVGSFHHFSPPEAKQILSSAYKSRIPICIFEISDNSTPLWLWWIAIPINFIMALFITLMVRPMSWQQLVFTYLIPIIPVCFAWDGAVSNARTYTLSDLDKLLDEVGSKDYRWKKGTIKGKTKQLYLLGIPENEDG